jgi:polyhydroxyalkanoate synthase subunit PhaC
MSSPARLGLTSISERMQSEVQRAIQRGIKGVEYFSTSGPSLGLTPKDILHSRGTMNLYHSRPIADEIYRVPILIVMATTNRGYILELVPGQSFIEFLLKRGYDVYMLDWSAPKPEEKGLRMEDYVLDFIPDCIRRVQQDSGEQDISVIGYCFGGVLSLLYGSIFHDGPMKNLICFSGWRIVRVCAMYAPIEKPSRSICESLSATTKSAACSAIASIVSGVSPLDEATPALSNRMTGLFFAKPSVTAGSR